MQITLCVSIRTAGRKRVTLEDLHCTKPLQGNQGKLIPLLLVHLRKPLSGPSALNSSIRKKFGSCIQFFGSALDLDWESGFFGSGLTLRSWTNLSWSFEILYGGLRSRIRIRIRLKRGSGFFSVIDHCCGIHLKKHTVQGVIAQKSFKTYHFMNS